MKRLRAFTLIELLIVVAIIAILAAIAVPNFLEAQTRAKVSRIKADMHSVTIALESYAVDNNSKYPYLKGYKILGHSQWDRGSFGAAVDLSTPIAYLSSVMVNDPFYQKKLYYAYGIDTATINTTTLSICINYVNVWLCRQLNNYKPVKDRAAWFLLSMGPDQVRGPNPWGPGAFNVGSYATSNLDPAKRFDQCNYDASNGTVSGGDIVKHQ